MATKKTINNLSSSKQKPFFYSHILWSTLTIFIFHFTINSYGPILPEFQKTILNLLYIVFIILVVAVLVQNKKLIRKNFLKSYTVILGILLPIIAFLINYFSNNIYLSLVSLILATLGIYAITNHFNSKQKISPPIILFLFITILVYLTITLLPSVSKYIINLSLSISAFFGSNPLGIYLSGLIILMTIAIWFSISIIWFVEDNKKKIFWLIIQFFLITLIWFSYLNLISSLNVSFSLNYGWWLIGLLFGCILIFSGLLRLVHTSVVGYCGSMIWMKKISQKTVVFLILGMLLFSFFFILVVPSAPDTTDESIDVVFLTDSMLGDWMVPQYGVYGRDAAGMFGLLPIYLSLFDFRVQVFGSNESDFVINVDEDNTSNLVNVSDFVMFREVSMLEADDLIDVEVVVIVNRNLSFADSELAVLWDFVEDGGGLLVLGDHTNVGGIRDPLNEVLRPFGIDFRFDSALPLDDRWQWETCAEVMGGCKLFHVLSNERLEVSVGASLEVGDGAFPCVVGRYGFSDGGEEENEGFAFLGDYLVNEGEQVGDIILSASSFFGNGRVLVFGDTSPFQNSALPRSYDWVLPVFWWLGGNDSDSFGWVLDLVGVGLCVLLVGVLLVRRDDWWFFVGGVFLFSMIFVSGSILGSLIVVNDFDGRHVVIDGSHVERFSVDGFLDSSLSGFELNLERNGLFPVYMFDMGTVGWLDAGVVVFNGPTRLFSNDFVDLLREYMQGGGVVMVAAGFGEWMAVRPLLSEFGISIEGVPLGPVPYGEDDPESFEFEPRFVNSWPVIFSSEESRSFYNFSWNDQVYHLVVFHPVGGGGLLVIGDSEFLYDRNLESLYDYWPGNIVFLKHIIDEVVLE